MKSIVIPLEFLKAIGEKPAPIRIYWIKWLAEYTDHIFKPDFIDLFVKDMEGKNLNIETIKQAYDFGIVFFDGGFTFIDNTKKVKKAYPNETMDIVKSVIEYLNLKCNSTYTLSKSNTECVASRIKEGYSLNDFKIVIDSKCRQWLGTEQEKYLRPITLFQASKFENYLNEPKNDNGKQKSTSAIAKLQSATAKAKEYFK